MNDDNDYSDRYSLPEPIRINRNRQQRRDERLCLFLLPTIVAGVFAYAALIMLGVIR